METILVTSILIRVAALLLSIFLLIRLKDWRMGFLTATLAIMTLRQTLTLVFETDLEHLKRIELPGALVSVAALLAVYFLGRMIVERQGVEAMLVARTHQQAAVARLGRVALEQRDLRLLMDEMAWVVRDTLDVDYSEVLKLLPNGKRLLLVAGSGWNEGLVGQATVENSETSQAGFTLAAGIPVIFDDKDSETRFDLAALLEEHRVSSGLSVIIQGEDDPIGILSAYATRKREFSADAIHFMESMASVLASAIDREAAEKALLDSEERFRQSQKLEALGRLAGGVAHDFNNLLTAILGYGELIMRNLDSAEATRGDAAEIVKAGERAAALTRQLLAFGRRQAMQPRVLDLNSVVENLEKMLRRLIGEDIELITKPNGGIANVKADPGQIEQVIMNLTVNARDAMPEGGRIEIVTDVVEIRSGESKDHVRVRPGSYVVVKVTDNGCGMDEEVRARVFEPFFTTKREGRGTGLGLSTVYGIAKQSDGYVWAASEPGQGTTFELWLPSVEEAVAAIQPEARTTDLRRGTETVVLVEDDETVRALAKEILEGAGYNVLEASEGEGALAVAGEHDGPIHLLLTDVIMPRMDGREVADRVLLRHPGVRVLFLSGYSDDTLGDRGVIPEDMAFLGKPFTPEALTSKVRQVLDSEHR